MSRSGGREGRIATSMLMRELYQRLRDVDTQPVVREAQLNVLESNMVGIRGEVARLDPDCSDNLLADGWLRSEQSTPLRVNSRKTCSPSV